MARGGILIEYGGLSAEPTPFPLPSVLSKSLTLRGYLVHELTADAVRLEAAKTWIPLFALDAVWPWATHLFGCREDGRPVGPFELHYVRFKSTRRYRAGPTGQRPSKSDAINICDYCRKSQTTALRDRAGLCLASGTW